MHIILVVHKQQKLCDNTGMDTCACIRFMMEKAGMSGRQLSAALGKYPTYIGTTLSKGGNVSAENLARMAAVMGFDLVIEGHGERVMITERAKDADSDQGTADKRGGA